MSLADTSKAFLRVKQEPEAFMVVVTSCASFEMRSHPKNRIVRIESGTLQLDVAIDLFEAFPATELGTVWAKQDAEDRVSARAETGLSVESVVHAL